MVDTKETINCPACNSVMTKIYMPETGVNIDICLDGCGGIYFDNRELEKFDEKTENADALLAQISGKTFKRVNGDEIRICPACGMPMAKMGAANGVVEIDVCHTCGGKFLDNGELQKIRKYKNNTEEVDHIIDEMLETAYIDKYGSPNASARRAFFEKIVKKFV